MKDPRNIYEIFSDFTILGICIQSYFLGFVTGCMTIQCFADGYWIVGIILIGVTWYNFSHPVTAYLIRKYGYAVAMK
jgi:hypothetical protein